ncbi:hypothetical protein B7463_g11129, partial [Scytalidium lignicola]
MTEISRKNQLAGFMDLPAEIQSWIISDVYSSGTKYPHYTAIFRTCKHLYQIAYPIFLGSYPLSCCPVKPGNPHARPGLSRGDILKIVYPHDDERFRMHLFEEEWICGLRSGMRDFFKVDDDDEAAKESDSDDTKEGEDEGDWDEIEGFDLNNINATLAEQAEQFAQY